MGPRWWDRLRVEQEKVPHWGEQVVAEQEKWDREHPPQVLVKRQWWCFFSLQLTDRGTTWPPVSHLGTAASANRHAQRMLARHRDRQAREERNRWVVR